VGLYLEEIQWHGFCLPNVVRYIGMSGILRSVVLPSHNHKVTKKEDVAKPRLFMNMNILKQQMKTEAVKSGMQEMLADALGKTLTMEATNVCIHTG
jgi:hypothetical protein